MRILIDIDETLNNLIETLLILYNEKYNDNLVISDITNYWVQQFLKPECKNIFAEFMTPALIENLSLNKGAKEVVENLAKNHSVYFVTASFPQSVEAKHNWLSKHFNFYQIENLVVCQDKSLIKGDVIVDDYSENLNRSPCTHKICFAKPWNRDCECQYRLKTWVDFDKYFRCIESYHNFTREVANMSSILDLAKLSETTFRKE